MLEQLVRPSSLKLAREAVKGGMQVEKMCLESAWNQRCLSCGLHSGWACVCTEAMKKRAYEEQFKRREDAEHKARLYLNAPEWIEKRFGLVPTEVSPQKVPTLDVPTKDTGFCDSCDDRPREGRYKQCAACRKKAYRERSK